MRTKFTSCEAILVLGLLACVSPSHAQWVKTSGPDSVRALATTNGALIYAGTKSGVFVSSDSGASWTAMNNGLTHMNVRSIIVRPGMIFAGTEGGGVFQSTNNGANWTAANGGLTSLDVRALAFSSVHLFAGTGGGVFQSTNNGANWTALNTGLTGSNIKALIAHPHADVFYAGTDSGIFLLASGASAWSGLNNGLTTYDIRSLVHNGNVFCAGTGAGVFRWGSAWNAVAGVPNLGIHVFAGASGIPDATPDVILAGTDGGGIYLTLGGAWEWNAINDGLTDLHVYAVATPTIFGQGYVFAGTETGVWRRLKSEVISGGWGSIRGGSGSPMRFRLDGHHSVSFTLPTRSRVTLEAFAPTGARAAVLLAEDLPSGAHTRRLNTAVLPNGLYFYRLRAGDATETRKVLLAR